MLLFLWKGAAGYPFPAYAILTGAGTEQWGQLQLQGLLILLCEPALCSD